jgi:glutamate 5-kinase
VKPRGAYIVDEGARKALAEKGRSLLPVGVVDVRGEFTPGDVVAIEQPDGREFARGLSNYSSAEARRMMGNSTAKLAELYKSCYEEMVHRDNLVLL